jgi:hypothetical protein
MSMTAIATSGSNIARIRWLSSADRRTLRNPSATKGRAMLSPECVRLRLARYRLLTDIATLREQTSGVTAWPTFIAGRMASLNGEERRLREAWLNLGCGSQFEQPRYGGTFNRR